MARSPKKAVNAEVLPPDYEGALSVFMNDVRPANKSQKQAMKEASDAWKVVKKDMRVHVGGFRLAMKIADMEEAEQQAFLRALHAGLEARKVVLHADLVDEAEGKEANTVIPVEFGKKDNRSDLDVPEGGEEEDEFDAADPARVAAE